MGGCIQQSLLFFKTKKTGEIQAKMFMNHVLTKEHSDLLQDGFRIYNAYVEKAKDDLRTKILAPINR